MVKRHKWTNEKLAAAVRSVAIDGVMPTSTQMRAATGSYALSVRVSRAGFDATADALGLARAQHSSRKGWLWEQRVGDMLEAVGMIVLRASSVKSPWDLMVNGRSVDVKAASGALHSGATQWTWRMETKYRCGVYIFVALDSGGEPATYFVAGDADVPRTCATVRESSVGNGYGKWSKFENNWAILA